MLKNISNYNFYNKFTCLFFALLVFYIPTIWAAENDSSCVNKKRLNEEVEMLQIKVEKLKRNEAHHSLHRKIAEKRLKRLLEEVDLAQGRPDCGDLEKRINELEEKLRKDSK